MNSQHEIYLDTLSIMDTLKEYASPKSKLTTLIKSGQIIQVRRGLYVPGDNADYCIETLANKIYGPSYVSFEYALSRYGFIPERVENVTSAVYNKNKNKTYNTPLGAFIYRRIPAAAYPRGYIRMQENAHTFLIANKEKALCDTLYRHRSITSYAKLSRFLLHDMRVDPEVLTDIDESAVEELVPLYQKRIIRLFAAWLKKEFSYA